MRQSVSCGGGEGHWLDRLAVAHTRRHAFKATLAAAAVTVPLVRSSRARAAEDLHACQKGCIYSSQRQHWAEVAKCNTKPIVTSLYVTMLSGFMGAPNLLFNEASILLCADRRHQESKERQELCGLNGCPGFDPAGEWGPCKNCATINGCQCCPDASAPTGYTYCSSLSNYCCNPGGGCRVCGS